MMSKKSSCSLFSGPWLQQWAYSKQSTFLGRRIVYYSLLIIKYMKYYTFVNFVMFMLSHLYESKTYFFNQKISISDIEENVWVFDYCDNSETTSHYAVFFEHADQS